MNARSTKKKTLGILNRLLNISPEEWPKVSYSFLLKLFFHSGHVIGHTVLLSMFAQRLGIDKLPYLFIIDAILVICGTAVFSHLLERVPKKNMVAALSVFALVFLVMARPLVHLSNLGFWAFLFFAYSILLTQLAIIIALLIEEQFTPLESERTFPVIESADLIGGLVGGGLVSLLTSQWLHSYVHTPDLLYIWAGFLFLVFAVNTALQLHKKTTLELELERGGERKGIFHELKDNVGNFRQVDFLKYLAIIVFFQFALFRLVEFQFTKAISYGSHGEDKLTHGLGIYTMALSGVGIVLQWFFASRIQKALGVVKTMLLHPGIAFLSFLPMLSHLNVVTATTGRFGFDITSVIYKNAYLSSYYAVKESIREKMKQLIEGWLLPLGSAFGMVLLLLLEGYFAHSHGRGLELSVEILILTFALIVFVLIWRLKSHYTALSVRALKSPHYLERLNAIELLGEQGHKQGASHLINNMKYFWNDEDALIKSLSVLKRLRDPRTIPAVLDLLDHESIAVKKASVDTLSAFSDIGKQFFFQAFARYRMNSALQSLFAREHSKSLKSAIINVFSNTNHLEVIPFLLDSLEKESDEIKADLVAVIGRFHDPNIYHYLKKHLDCQDPYIRANAIIALWQFSEHRLELLIDLVQMLSSKDRDTILATLYALGEIKAKQEIKKIHEFVDHQDPEIKMQAVVALAKMGVEKSLDVLIDMMLSDDSEAAEKAKKLWRQIDSGVEDTIGKMLHQEVSLRVRQILAKSKGSMEKLSKKDLDDLERLYMLIDKEKEAVKVRRVLKEES